MIRHYYCPFCGESQFRTNIICTHCSSRITLVQSIHDVEYYSNKSIEIYGDDAHWNEVLISEEVSKNPLYNPKMRDEEKIKRTQDAIFDRIFNTETINNPNIPKCPTCQSTKIKKISVTKKAVHGFAFGLFSNTARSQFECENCGYKW